MTVEGRVVEARVVAKVEVMAVEMAAVRVAMAITEARAAAVYRAPSRLQTAGCDPCPHRRRCTPPQTPRPRTRLPDERKTALHFWLARL